MRQRHGVRKFNKLRKLDRFSGAVAPPNRPLRIALNFTMNIEQAKEELSFHSGRNSNTEDRRWERGFLGSLRPYQSMELVESNFHDIITCLKDLAPYLMSNETIDRNLVSDVAAILCLGKAWAVHEEGMLLRNKIITASQARAIDGWLDCISYAWAMILDSQDESLAFEPYNELYKI